MILIDYVAAPKTRCQYEFTGPGGQVVSCERPGNYTMIEADLPGRFSRVRLALCRDHLAHLVERMKTALDTKTAVRL